MNAAAQLAPEPSALGAIIGMMILFFGVMLVLGGAAAFVDAKDPKYLIGFALSLLGSLVLALGAKAVGWIS